MKEVHIYEHQRKLCNMTDEIFDWLESMEHEAAYAISISMEDAPEDIQQALKEAGYTEREMAMVIAH